MKSITALWESQQIISTIKTVNGLKKVQGFWSTHGNTARLQTTTEIHRAR